MKKYLPHLLLVLLLAVPVTASAIKVWVTGETLRAADLNANFAHIHNTKVGDGTLLVNADVSSSAAIAHSKLATPALVPKIFGLAAGATSVLGCTASPCTLYANTGLTSTTRSGVGTYVFTFPARANVDYVTFLTAYHTVSAVFCVAQARTTTTVTAVCADAAGAATDAAVSFMIMDDA